MTRKAIVLDLMQPFAACGQFIGFGRETFSRNDITLSKGPFFGPGALEPADGGPPTWQDRYGKQELLPRIIAGFC
jgi:hypothetical protein